MRSCHQGTGSRDGPHDRVWNGHTTSLTYAAKSSTDVANVVVSWVLSIITKYKRGQSGTTVRHADRRHLADILTLGSDGSYKCQCSEAHLCGQWLVMNKPCAQTTDLIPQCCFKVPKLMQWFVACLHFAPEIWTDDASLKILLTILGIGPCFVHLHVRRWSGQRVLLDLWERRDVRDFDVHAPNQNFPLSEEQTATCLDRCSSNSGRRCWEWQ